MGYNSWDLVHMRMLNGSITNWPRLYGEIYRYVLVSKSVPLLS